MSSLRKAVEATACPACGEFALTLETRLAPKPLGDFSLAGVQMKFSAVEEVWIKCTDCGVEAKGHK